MKFFGGEKPQAPVPESNQQQGEQKEQRGIIREIRRSPLRDAVFALGIAIGGVGIGAGIPFAKDKISDREEIKREKRYVEEGKKALEKLDANDDKLRVMFGDYADYGYVEAVEEISEKEDAVTELEENFSWITTSSRLREKKKQGEQLMLTKEKNERAHGIKTELIVAKDAKGNDVALASSDVEDVLLKTFPNGWAQSGTKEILQVNTKYNMPDKYNLDQKKWTTFAIYKSGEKNEGGVITFFKVSKTEQLENFINRFMSHELSHGADWSLTKMSVEERQELLLAIMDRICSDDREKFEYVESINNKDSHLEMYTKAGEYWAEICRLYFSAPETMNFVDFKIVDDWVKKYDPTFDVLKVNKMRQDLLANDAEIISNK